MNKKFVISCLLILTMTITGCTGLSKDLMKGYTSDIGTEIAGSVSEEFKRAYLSFSWDILKKSSENSGNIMISPVSIYLALAMTQNGASGLTKEQIGNTLYSEKITEDDLNAEIEKMMNYLNEDDDEAIDLTIANSIWYREGFEADETFLQKNADYYSAAVKSLDFANKEATDEINSWVSDATNKTIDKIIDKISEDVMMYLINAVYFKGDWKVPFSSNKTYKQDFNSPQGVVDADFMSRSGNMDYFKSGGAEGIVLPYKGDKFAFFALMSGKDKTAREMINELSPLKIGEIIGSKETKNLELSLPKFESRYEDSLVDELSKMGMKIAFEPGNADFSFMQKSRNKNLYISDVKHKTFIKVDEKGTEAAAVTSVEVKFTGMPVGVQSVVFDRPFVYGIVDLENGLPLFIGIMENPSE